MEYLAVIRCSECKHYFDGECMLDDGDGDYLRITKLPSGFCDWAEASESMDTSVRNPGEYITRLEAFVRKAKKQFEIDLGNISSYEESINCLKNALKETYELLSEKQKRSLSLNTGAVLVEHEIDSREEVMHCD